MPALTEQQIRNAIVEETIGAVSLDTNVFDRFGCDLSVAILRKLDQFRNTPVAVLFSEVVAREVKRHISRQAEETGKRLNAALQNHRKRWEAAYDIDALAGALGLDLDSDETASQQFDIYVEHIGAGIVPVNGNVDLDEMIDRYFNARPPFETKEKKKNEFPDALVLLSLQARAESSKKMILIVSKDGGWQAFAKQSESLVCVNEIDTALDHFNHAGRFAADGAIMMLRRETAPKLMQEIDAAIEARLDHTDFEIDADSSLEFEYEPVSAALQRWRIPEIAQPRIIAADEETVTFSIQLEVLVNFEAHFDFFVKDSIDKDYVSLGAETLSNGRKIGLSIVATIGREIDPEPDVVEVEAIKRRVEVSFGFIEPDWGHEE